MQVSRPGTKGQILWAQGPLLHTSIMLLPIGIWAQGPLLHTSIKLLPIGAHILVISKDLVGFGGKFTGNHRFVFQY